MMSTGTYFAESALEAIRLLRKTDLDLTFRQLDEANLHHVQPGARIADIGAGVGIVGFCMDEMLSQRNIGHHVYSVDLSFNRLSQSALHRQRIASVSNVVGNARSLPFPSDCLDFVFSRFLFEYLPDPLAALVEIVRVVRPGGKIVISDLDLNCLCFYPASDAFNDKLQRIARILHEHHLFDALIGRKLYTFYKLAGLSGIDLRMEAYNVLYGTLGETAYSNWLMKIRYICDGPRKFNIDYGFDVDAFREEFISVISNPDRFSYAPLITIEGVKM